MSSTKQGSVLCVDDEPSILRSLQWLLQSDFDIKTAIGGEEGLRAIKDHDFDVVMSDQRMPGMAGAQFLARVKEVSPRSMRLLLTGYSDMPALLSSVNEGEIWQFVKKPWENDELKSLLATAARLAQNSAGAVFAPLPEATSGDNVLLISHDQEVYDALADTLDKDIRILRAVTLAEAVHVLATERISAIVSESRVGTTDIARFLTLVKQKRPEIVSVVISDGTDGEQLIRLINCGQLYRFLNKPLKKGHLQFFARNALAKHYQLLSDPLMRSRYVAATVDMHLEEALMQELGLSEAAELPGANGQAMGGSGNRDAGFFRKLRSGFAKLLGRS